jgi:VCBS repeat-containing protein
VDVSVHAVKDYLVEDDETVTVTTTGDGIAYTGVGNAVTLTVIDTTLPPVAMDEYVKTGIDTPVGVSVTDLVINLDGGALTVTGVTQGSNGTVTFDSGGSVAYTPDIGFSGDDSFTYTVEDPGGNEATGTILVTVTAPAAPPFSVWTPPNTAVTFDAAAAAADPDGDALTVTAVTQGGHGSVAINLDGTVTYTPTSTFRGDDSFTYTVEDPDGNESTDTVTVTVQDSVPVALDADVTTDQDMATTVTVLNSALSLGSVSLSVTAVTQGGHGTVVLNGDGTVTYTPASGYTGPDSFTYTVTDANAHTATGTINMTVGSPPATPVDDINSALAGIQTDVENFDSTSGNASQTAAAIQTAVDGVVGATDAYLNTATEFINTVNTAAGANLSVSQFASQRVAAYVQLYPEYQALENLKLSLRDSLRDNKEVLESLIDAWKSIKLSAYPNELAIYALESVITYFEGIHVRLEVKLAAAQKAADAAYFMATLTYMSLGDIARYVPVPPLPVEISILDLRPQP